ncbi:flavodoxin family protein [Salipaludibacillus sp. LMS25]|jgi:multimeric flavodoxin WrbA|uniref:flavodoxin family protein n=1 Tax=Salipaludibacillus sp. LMS25 TaxID=2924031 RepID=UPI0020D0E9F6|nr:flavodoxin family protein [Salipaludibacillus sp. LMS25]UTR13759.1 flavodoxin family protein [Salipaludibacillus sp. LMS25]
MKIMLLLGSSRKEGNSEQLAKEVLKDVPHTHVFLHDKLIYPIRDKRHSMSGFTTVDDDYEELLQHFLAHDIVIFATPLYWFGMSGQMKTFFDRWSQYLRHERFDLKGKLAEKKAYVIITGNKPDPKVSALPLIMQFNAIFQYAEVTFEDYLIGTGNKPGEIFTDAEALQKARLWNSQFRSLKL